MNDTSTSNQLRPTRAESVAENVLRMLEFDVSYSGWEHQTAKQKAFYVRGFTWFRDNVLNGKLNITDCDTYVGEMKTRLQTRSKWLERKLDWQDDFGARQFINAASPIKRLTPKFHKAVECLLLCEVIADDLHKRDRSQPTGAAIYDHMTIEAAVSFIHGFHRGTLDALSDRERSALRTATGQQSDSVFYDMAEGKTVTHKLAQRTHRFFVSRRQSARLGEVSFRFFANRKYKPSEHEIVEVAESDLPHANRSP